jgi:hypothetical protein
MGFLTQPVPFVLNISCFYFKLPCFDARVVHVYCRTDNEASELCNQLQKACIVLRHKDSVYLRPEEIAEAGKWPSYIHAHTPVLALPCPAADTHTHTHTHTRTHTHTQTHTQS